MRGTLRIAAAAAAVALGSGAAGAAAHFAAEEVTISVAPPTVTVEGKYRFYNASTEPYTFELKYPFARGPGLGDPANISVRDGAGEALPFSWKYHRIAFDVVVPPNAEAEVVVAYDQPCDGCEYTYLLAGTRGWQRPIAAATYAVEVPPQLAPVEGSYRLEEIPAREGVVRYELRREDFYPDVDLVLRWKRPEFYFGSTALEGDD